jgi:hypothetical protein
MRHCGGLQRKDVKRSGPEADNATVELSFGKCKLVGTAAKDFTPDTPDSVKIRTWICIRLGVRGFVGISTSSTRPDTNRTFVVVSPRHAVQQMVPR